MTGSLVAGIEGDLSDPHNGGHSVLIVRFEDGSRVVYKPKDLRLDVAWHALVERLNRSGAPVELKAVHAIARDGYGWTEFIDHAGCAEAEAASDFSGGRAPGLRCSIASPAATCTRRT